MKKAFGKSSKQKTVQKQISQHRRMDCFWCALPIEEGIGHRALGIGCCTQIQNHTFILSHFPIYVKRSSVAHSRGFDTIFGYSCAKTFSKIILQECISAYICNPL